MAFFDFLHQKKDGQLVSLLLDIKASELKIKELAIEKAINLIANTISKLEIKIYKSVEGKVVEVQDELYHQLNVRANLNETGTLFWRKVINKLLYEQEALIIRTQNKGLFMADTFTKSNDIMNPVTFSSISIGGEILNKKYSAKLDGHGYRDSVYFDMTDNKIVNLINGYFIDYGKLLKYAMTDYRIKNSTKFKIKLPMIVPVSNTYDEEGEPIVRRLAASEFAKIISDDLFSEEGKAIPIGDDVGLEKIMGGEVKTSQDIRDLMKQAFDTVALAFNIPLDIFYGNKTDKSTSIDDFITFAIEPVIEILQDGLNGSFVSIDDFIKGERIVIDTTTIKHVDIFDVAQNIGQLRANSFSHNDVLGYLHQPKINEDWANERNITLNYTRVNSDINDGKGG